MRKLYKTLGSTGSPSSENDMWPLPRGDSPGWWTKETEVCLTPRKKGYYVCRKQDLVHWVSARIYEVEIDDCFIETDNGILARKARLLKKLETWNDRTARLFAVECAERVFHIIGGKCPNELAMHEVIRVSRDFANGEVGSGELEQVSNTAWGVLRVVKSTMELLHNDDWVPDWVSACEAAVNTSRSASWGAAQSTATSASNAANDPTEREWQTNRLMQYLYGGEQC